MSWDFDYLFCLLQLHSVVDSARNFYTVVASVWIRVELLCSLFLYVHDSWTIVFCGMIRFDSIWFDSVVVQHVNLINLQPKFESWPENFSGMRGYRTPKQRFYRPGFHPFHPNCGRCRIPTYTAIRVADYGFQDRCNMQFCQSSKKRKTEGTIPNHFWSTRLAGGDDTNYRFAFHLRELSVTLRPNLVCNQVPGFSDKFSLVRKEGIKPSCLSAVVPKTTVYINSTTFP